MIKLSALFFLTALMYAAVGFGGGSTYNALLVLAGVNYLLLPTIALSCNIIVVTGGVVQYARAGHINIKKLLPWIITSIPAAWLGGYIHVSEKTFTGLLGFSLLLAGLKVFWSPNVSNKKIEYPSFLPYVIGSGLGLLSGVVGIGGGIFLSPILYLLRWDNAKAIAGTASLFILVNSVAGLSGQLFKLDTLEQVTALQDYIWVFPAVFIGGQIGSHLGVHRLKAQTVQRLTAALILFVSVRLIWKWIYL